MGDALKGLFTNPPPPDMNQMTQGGQPDLSKIINYQQPSILLSILAGLGQAAQNPATPTNPLAPLFGGLGGFARAREAELAQQQRAYQPLQQYAVEQAMASNARAARVKALRYNAEMLKDDDPNKQKYTTAADLIEAQSEGLNRSFIAQPPREQTRLQEQKIEQDIKTGAATEQARTHQANAPYPQVGEKITRADRATNTVQKELASEFESWAKTQPKDMSFAQAQWTPGKWAMRHPEGQAALQRAIARHQEARTGIKPWRPVAARGTNPSEVVSSFQEEFDADGTIDADEMMTALAQHVDQDTAMQLMAEFVRANSGKAK
jgi:hypothetical protein